METGTLACLLIEAAWEAVDHALETHAQTFVESVVVVEAMFEC